MRIYIRVKTVGKRKDVLQSTPYILPNDTSSLRQLLTAIVEAEVERYNLKDTDTQLITHLTTQQIEDKTIAGKVSFGTVFSDKKADIRRAVETAVQCWKDGLVRVFMDETELTDLDEALSIRENAQFTFIRLTFLAGRMW